MTNLDNLTVKQTAKLLEEKQISAVELTKFYLEKIRQKESALEAFLYLAEKEALSQAEEIDLSRQKGDQLGSLAGIPYAVKDNILVKGVQATAGSKVLQDYQASYDASVILKLKKAGAIMIGKTNCDEFAMGSSTENSAYQKTKNPYDLSRVPGGSSGGSAAAVSAGMSLFALGTDTGGSIRQPASFCGVVGLKPTYGAVSRHGAIALASSLDQIGPLAKTIEDTGLVFETIAGKDKFDATTSGKAVYQGLTGKLIQDFDFKSLRIGVPEEFFGQGLEPEVKALVEKAINWYESQGAAIEKIELPHSPYGLATYYIVLPAEVSANLARYDGIRYPASVQADDFRAIYFKTRGKLIGPEPRRRIMLGAFSLSSGYYDAYYSRAQKVRQLIKRDFDQAFEKVDLIMTPTSPFPAFKFGERMDNPVAMYLADIYTVPLNLAGVPGLSINCGFAESEGEKLPVGLQIIGKHFSEELILRAAYQYEKAHS
ncbi:MAG: Asp-tRNA(Asn)/Glu-tRNA(Gln) amidotransferase subunit GatA [Patescibacteria group bacterium]